MKWADHFGDNLDPNTIETNPKIIAPAVNPKQSHKSIIIVSLFFHHERRRLVVIPRSKFNETNHDQAKLDRAQDCHLNKPDPNIIAWIIEKWGLVSYRLKHKRIESACQEKRTPKKHSITQGYFGYIY
jgi:hypothetical protein